VTPRHFKLIVLLLPLLIARSVLPIGFMLSFDGGTPQLVFCPAQSAPSQSNATDAHAAHHASHHEHHHGPGHNDSNQSETGSAEHVTQCPFAFAAAAPLAFADDFVAEPLPAEAITGPSASAILIVALGAHPIRGPPALS
jgi:hypothetical protein